MHPLTQSVARLLEDHPTLLPAGITCVVAVSGGPDSMALLHVLSELATELTWSLVVAHVDHGLRPDEAAHEVSSVEVAAARLGWPIAHNRVNAREHARQWGLSIEHAARDLRYDFLRAVATRHGATRIAVGHTADDQTEEVLVRLIRGSGRAGLSGMALLRDEMVVRPLLNVLRADLLDYLATRHISFCEDSSNRDRRYLRNRIRLDLLPLLAQQFNPAIRATLRETAAILAAEEELLVAWNDHACARVMHEEHSESGQTLVLDLAGFAAEPLALQRRMLETACWRKGSRPSFRQVEQLRSLATKGHPGGSLHLAHGLRAMRDRNRLFLSHPQGRQATRGNLSPCLDQPAYEVVIPAPGTHPIGTSGAVVELTLLDGVVEPKAHDRQTLYLDGDSVEFPLIMRPFKPGDRFHPLGAPGSKKVGNFFTDQKIPATQRWLYPVLVDRHGIVAVLGLRPDQRASVGIQTSRILAVRNTLAAVNKMALRER